MTYTKPEVGERCCICKRLQDDISCALCCKRRTDEKKFKKEIAEALEGHRRNLKQAIVILENARNVLEPTYKRKLDKIFANIFLCLDDPDASLKTSRWMPGKLSQYWKCPSFNLSTISPAANAEWMSIPVSICADQITKSAAISLRESGLEHLNVSCNAKLRKIAVKIIDRGEYYLMKYLRMV
ncbi:hypothetical protein GUITHDRAFT_148531 [Guillardia theta CCMP2712]|uniref:Uncharacterized protein n=1 Tax=Guillardia theta (strain CCMP2712) TaxID=905079 RepID=L1I8Z7_GUITC|nr:hypothetical protein GUITHDRAFT_148531 [Guillardia theta CCMP2712]EKX32582.1 hypothetical protein GUITHDRAFT_148531 [Guillardia theta CCMP2712]|eukprot:XP_005819562.1 hypothetical protein GUITHDRAFT_148531 [Guillardia theta CCMP2712]